LFGALGTATGVGQAWCAAVLLAAALTGQPRDTLPLLGGFALLALSRAALSLAAERAAFNAGATARRRLRTDALSRLLQSGRRGFAPSTPAR
jgi:ABC-type transport system involved in cytochrome bd biosynthesis fused ATPase/permease subunit